jgi:hyperosmotically inducible protein
MKKLAIILALFAFVMIGCKSMTGETTKEATNDAAIVSNVNGKILADPDLKFLQINVNSYEGNVTLTGRVPSEAAQTKLIDMAKSTKLVKSVTPNLVVGSTEPAPSASVPSNAPQSSVPSSSEPVVR